MRIRDLQYFFLSINGFVCALFVVEFTGAKIRRIDIDQYFPAPSLM